MECIIINHAQLMIDQEEGVVISTTANGEKNMRTRVYSVRTTEHCEFLLLTLNDIDRMKKEHYSIAKRFIKRQM
jgi:hypothetical protein